MNKPLWIRCTLLACLIGLTAGCPGPIQEDQPKGPATQADSSADQPPTESQTTGVTYQPAPTQPPSDAKQSGASAQTPAAQQSAGRVSTATAEDVSAARELLDSLGSVASYTLVPDGVMTAVSVTDGSTLTRENLALFGRLNDLESLEILDFRDLNDEAASQLAGLKNLKTLALTNSVIGDPTVEMIATSFPGLTSLDLSSNPNLTSGVLKTICQLTNLERLTLMQNRFQDLSTGSLSKLEKLKLLDLRGNMQVGDMTMETLGLLPNLAQLKHRSSTVSDLGIELLAESKSLKALLLQDAKISSDAGAAFARMESLRELEIFRCQEFGTEGVLALQGMPLTRLQLRGLPAVQDDAMAVFADLPKLQRLYLQELDSISDTGLVSLGNLMELAVLDLWELPQVGDATVEVIASLPKLKELSIRGTAVTDAAVDKLLVMPALERLTFTDNGQVTPEALQKLTEKKWVKLDTGK